MLQASTLTQGRLANSPMRFGSSVKRIRGITAKGSCMLIIAWLRSSSHKVDCSPKWYIVITAGMIASVRVIRRRIQGRMRRSRNPSMTIWPA